MLRALWDRLHTRDRGATERAAARQQMSSDERRAVDQGIDGLKADTFVAEHLGGIEADRVLGADEPPPP